MPVSQVLKNKHLLLRAGFGCNLSQISDLEIKTNNQFWKDLILEKPFKSITFKTQSENLDYQSLAKMDTLSKKEFQQRNRMQIAELNLNFLNEMVYSEDQLREKMAFFWHGHFATRVINAKFNVQLLNIIRENALGNFGNLLAEVSKSPAMLNFLNNQQNKKNHPNENFAREVMELFTMGRGNYTENDIKEGAKAFSGWGFDKEANFKERKIFHDFGEKKFLGKTGNFDGNDILKIILEQKTTAKFITTKIYKFFVNENVNENIINELSEKFYDSDYNIKNLMTEIFTSAWFYEEKNIGAKIKSPIELIAGIMRTLPLKIGNPENIIIYQKLLGQMLFYPPNVSGWPNGKSWIDSSSLLLRMQIPQIWSGLRPLELSPKEDDDLEMGIKTLKKISKNFKNPNITIDWNLVEPIFKNKNISDVLLQKKSSLDENTIVKFSNSSVKQEIINIMSTPEFQLC